MQYIDYLNTQFPKTEFFHFTDIIPLADFYLCSGKEPEWWKRKSSLPKIKTNLPKKGSTIYSYNLLDLSACIQQCKENRDNQYIIIQSRTDHPTTRKLTKRLPPNIIRIFSHNIETTRHGRIIALPYGTKFDKKDQQHDRRNLAIENFKFPNRINYHKRKLLYCNFSLYGHSYRRTLRLKLYARLHHKKLKKWITFRHMGNFGEYPLRQSQYYDEMLHHKFTLSPQGTGIDCYRTWEALYLKSIPIVQKSRHMNHFADLPILFTRDYEEINEQYLKDQYKQILEKEFNFNKLKSSYWKNRIVTEKQLLKT